MKKTRFVILSQKQAESLDKYASILKGVKKPVMISITSPLEDLARIQLDIPILRLQFDDIDKKEISKFTDLPLKPFTKIEAMQIIDFIEFEKPDLVIVHCKAGICRSAATAAALSKIIFGSDDKIFREKVPNMLVYTTILEYWFVDLMQYSEVHKEVSAAHLHPWIYKQRIKAFKLLH